MRFEKNRGLNDSTERFLGQRWGKEIHRRCNGKIDEMKFQDDKFRKREYIVYKKYFFINFRMLTRKNWNGGKEE